eukprot:552093-Alexandrium_andersonii.AAC.1
MAASRSSARACGTARAPTGVAEDRAASNWPHASYMTRVKAMASGVRGSDAAATRRSSATTS